jgi:hypothetical protein
MGAIQCATLQIRINGIQRKNCIEILFVVMYCRTAGGGNDKPIFNIESTKENQYSQ